MAPKKPPQQLLFPYSTSEPQMFQNWHHSHTGASFFHSALIYTMHLLTLLLLCFWSASLGTLFLTIFCFPVLLLALVGGSQFWPTFWLCAPKNAFHAKSLPRSAQEPPKSLQRASQEAPFHAKSLPRSAQEPPKSLQRASQQALGDANAWPSRFTSNGNKWRFAVESSTLRRGAKQKSPGLSVLRDRAKGVSR